MLPFSYTRYRSASLVGVTLPLAILPFRYTRYRAVSLVGVTLPLQCFPFAIPLSRSLSRPATAEIMGVSR